MEQLDGSDRQRLLAIARRSLEAAVRREPRGGVAETAPSAGMTRPAAAFVTIHEHGDLRGCIGLMRFEVALWQNVRDAAAAAALDDPRFLPVDASELPDLVLEVSVLEPPVAIPSPARFVAGRHGIVIERGMHRGLLLPQVATEMGWDETQMLEGVCRKANLPLDAWCDGSARLFVFESVCFGETAVARPPSGLATAP